MAAFVACSISHMGLRLRLREIKEDQFLSVSPLCQDLSICGQLTLKAHSNSLLSSPASQPLPCGPNVKSEERHAAPPGWPSVL